MFTVADVFQHIHTVCKGLTLEEAIQWLESMNVDYPYSIYVARSGQVRGMTLQKLLAKKQYKYRLLCDVGPYWVWGGPPGTSIQYRGTLDMLVTDLVFKRMLTLGLPQVQEKLNDVLLVGAP